jgi:hypothetical protein
MKIRAAMTLLSLAAVAACSSTPATSGTPRPSRDLITRDEISATPATTAYEAIERLRPEYLRAVRGGGPPNVYVNGSSSGGISVLRSIRADNVAEIRYLDAVAANLRFGLNNNSGVINVQLTR